MNIAIKNNIFFCICIAVLFNNVPRILQMNFLGGSILGNKLCIYPLIIAMGYTIWCQYKGTRTFILLKDFKKWSIAYFFIG